MYVTLSHFTSNAQTVVHDWCTRASSATYITNVHATLVSGGFRGARGL